MQTVSVPRARIEGEDGRVTEWRSKALPRYQRLTKKAEALIASVYLAGTNTRRVKRALFGLFQGAVSKDVVSRAWRKVKVDWDAWVARSLADEDIVRLILDGTVIKTRLDRKATNISALAATRIAEPTGSDRDFGYDAVQRLVSGGTAAAAESYSYDAEGNRLVSHLSAAHTTDDGNRLLQDDTFDYVYDDIGERPLRAFLGGPRQDRLELGVRHAHITLGSGWCHLSFLPPLSRSWRPKGKCDRPRNTHPPRGDIPAARRCRPRSAPPSSAARAPWPRRHGSRRSRRRSLGSRWFRSRPCATAPPSTLTTSSASPNSR
jgi:YD repeat-containing protein